MRGVLDPVPNKSQCGSWIVRLEYLGHCAGRERLEQNSAAARQSFAFPITGIRGWSQMLKKNLLMKRLHGVEFLARLPSFS